MAIRAVLSDLGGVLIRLSWRNAFDFWARSVGQDADAIERRFRFDAEYAAWETGAITEASFLDHLRTMIGAPLDLPAFEKGWNRVNAGINLGVFNLYRRLRAEGVRIVGVTNTNPVHRRHLSVKYARAFAALDSIYASTDLQARNPGPIFFDRVLAAVRLTKSQVVFFDDTQSIVLGAEAYGIRSFVYTDPASMARALRDLGVLP